MAMTLVTAEGQAVIPNTWTAYRTTLAFTRLNREMDKAPHGEGVEWDGRGVGAR